MAKKESPFEKNEESNQLERLVSRRDFFPILGLYEACERMEIRSDFRTRNNSNIFSNKILDYSYIVGLSILNIAEIYGYYKLVN